VTPVLFLLLVHYSDVKFDVIERKSDLDQLTDDVVSVALPARSAHICNIDDQILQ